MLQQHPPVKMWEAKGLLFKDWSPSLQMTPPPYAVAQNMYFIDSS